MALPTRNRSLHEQEIVTPEETLNQVQRHMKRLTTKKSIEIAKEVENGEQTIKERLEAAHEFLRNQKKQPAALVVWIKEALAQLDA